MESGLGLSPSPPTTFPLVELAISNLSAPWLPQTTSPPSTSPENMSRQVVSQLRAEIAHLTNQSQNRTLTDDVDEMLTLQGVGWISRKIIKNATITLYVRHYKDGLEDVERIDIDQTVTGGISGPSEYRTLNWTSDKINHSFFGAIVAKSRRIPLAEVTDEYLSSGWLPDVSRDGVIQSYAEADEEKNTHHWKSDVVSKFAHTSRALRMD